MIAAQTRAETTRFRRIRHAIGFLPRMLAITLALAAPVLTVPSLVQGASDTFIGATQGRSNGVGFVLLVSLQR